MSEIKDTENVTSEVVQEVASEVTAENSPGDHEAQQANILDFDDYELGEIIDVIDDTPILRTADGALLISEYESDIELKEKYILN